MASIVKRGEKYTAQIRKTGPDGRKRSVSKTFSSREEAELWSKKVEEIHVTSGAGHGSNLTPIEVAILPRYDAVNGSCGVYFLFDGYECVYVGKSTHVHVRVREHRTKNASRKAFDSYSFIPVDACDLDKVEAHYIALLRPRLNDSQNPDRPRSKSWLHVLKKKRSTNQSPDKPLIYK